MPVMNAGTITTRSITYFNKNDTDICCFVPSMFHADDSIASITDLYCNIDGAYVNGYSICFEIGMIADEDTDLYFFVRDEKGQWYQTQTATFADLVSGTALSLDLMNSSDPRKHSDDDDEK